MRRFPADTRADSEAVGFAFVFAMALLSILLVTVTGQAGLTDVRDEGRVVNAVSAMEVLIDNVDDVVYDGAPSRSTAVRLDDATLGVGPATTVAVTVDGVERARYDLPSLVYDAGTGSRLAFVNGALIRSDRAGQRLLREPPLRLSADEVSLTLVRLTPVGERPGTGGGTADVRTTSDGAAVLVAEDGAAEPHTVMYAVTGPNADVWERHLETEVGGCIRTGDTVACTVVTERVYVTAVDLRVRFD